MTRRLRHGTAFGAVRRALVRRALPLLLVAGTASAAVNSRVDTSRTRGNNDYSRTSCLLPSGTRSAGEVSLPVGGKLYVRLHGECGSSFSCGGNQIDNTKYGFPGTAQTTTFTQHGWLSFAPTVQFAGSTYEVCSRTVDAGVVHYTCMKVSVKSHRAQFAAQAPAGGAVLDATVGRSFQIPLPVDSLIDGGCNFSAPIKPNPCIMIPDANPPQIGQITCAVLKQDSACSCDEWQECIGSCECMTECPLGPLPSVKVLADISYPKSASGLPDGATLSLQTHLPDMSLVTSQTRPQPWVFKWQPTHDQRSLVPVKLCFGAFKASDPATGTEDHRCYSLRVTKCRQCVQLGDTLGSIAAQHQTDWLNVYLANPFLPGFNPSHVKVGYNLRLGVMYGTRWGDDLERLSERFLVPQSALLAQNPELSAPTSVTYSPDAQGANTQVSVVLGPRRRIREGENFTVPLEVVEGDDWDGLISETCEAPVSTFEKGKYCSPRIHAVDDACGPGLWGSCKYDESGYMGCLTHACNGRGEHSAIAGASWKGDRALLTLTASTNLEAGALVRVVIPQSAGLRLPVGRQAPTQVFSLVPVPDKIWDPVLENYVAMEICVVLPVCDAGVECLYGSDCHYKQDSVAQ